MDQQPVSPQQPLQPAGPDPVVPAQPQPVVNQPADTTGVPQIGSMPQQAPTPEIFGMTQPVAAQSAKKPRGKKKLKVLLMVLLCVAVLGGGSAAAYYGVVVPNKPENILKAAVKNTLMQKSVTAKTHIEGKVDGAAYKAELTIKGSQEKKAASVDAQLTVSGFTFSGEIRYVDKSAYVKVGDLSNITSILGAAGNEQLSTLATALNTKVANQWFEIDDTLLKTGDADCLLQSDASLTEADFQILASAYSKNPFVTISKTSSDTVNGKAATKYELVIDDKKADAYGGTFNNLSVIKKIDECAKKTNNDNQSFDQDITSTVKDATSGTGKTPFTLWVDKSSKTISQLSIETTDQQEKQDKMEAKIDATFDYAAVSVDKPSGAKPITSLVGELMQLYQDQPVLGAKIERLVP